MNNFYKAIEYDTKALNMRIDLFGEAHPEIAQSYFNLSVSLSKINQEYLSLKYD